MKYTWKHGIQIVSNHTFKTEDPLEVGRSWWTCARATNTRFFLLRSQEQNEVSSFTDFGQQESAQTRRSLSYAKTAVILLRQSANLPWTFGGHGLCARSS